MKKKVIVGLSIPYLSTGRTDVVLDTLAPAFQRTLFCRLFRLRLELRTDERELGACRELCLTQS